MVYWFCRDDDLVTTRCILKQSFIIFTTYNSLLTAFISLLETAFRLAFKKGAFTTLELHLVPLDTVDLFAVQTEATIKNGSLTSLAEIKS